MQPIFMAVPSPRLGPEYILCLLWIVDVFPLRHIGESQWEGVEHNRVGKSGMVSGERGHWQSEGQDFTADVFCWLAFLE
jgi:hypothetical protein